MEVQDAQNTRPVRMGLNDVQLQKRSKRGKTAWSQDGETKADVEGVKQPDLGQCAAPPPRGQILLPGAQMKKRCSPKSRRLPSSSPRPTPF